jgi:hypothetical protein
MLGNKQVLVKALNNLKRSRPVDAEEPEVEEEKKLADLEAIMSEFESADTPSERAQALKAFYERMQ